MEKVESLEEFYKRKFDWVPDTIKNEIGHFNVFELTDEQVEQIKPIYRKMFEEIKSDYIHT